MNCMLATACFTLILAGASNASGHTIAVDGNPADWPLTAPTNDNLGHIARNAVPQGEYAWNDMVADERTGFAPTPGGPDAQVDIRELRITADNTNLYVLVRMTDLAIELGDGAPQIQVAIDRDYTVGSGEVWLAAMADTMTAAAAAWEYLVVTTFGSGGANPAVYTAGSWVPVGGGAQAISAANDTIEIAIPWTLLGGLTVGPLQFTVVSLRANAADEA